MRKILGLLALLPIASAGVLAHHGWGSYDASKRFSGLGQAFVYLSAGDTSC